ncbi:MAG TPA: alpha amylase C-terminal domain-containing protein, partial [Bacteroidales bacterium]|nr:alpha amylase C-terminal domain-containing protein [Bacteroidales bacterium]
QVMTSLFGNQLNMDEANKTIVFERQGLIFVFNFHPTHSIADYAFPVPRHGEYRIILNSDSKAFGGHGRIDDSITYYTFSDPSGNWPYLKIYNTNRTALVLKFDL